MRKEVMIDYQASKIQISIKEFNEKTLKPKVKKIKELEDKIKRLKIQLTNQSV